MNTEAVVAPDVLADELMDAIRRTHDLITPIIGVWKSEFDDERGYINCHNGTFLVGDYKLVWSPDNQSATIAFLQREDVEKGIRSAEVSLTFQRCRAPNGDYWRIEPEFHGDSLSLVRHDAFRATIASLCREFRFELNFWLANGITDQNAKSITFREIREMVDQELHQLMPSFLIR